MSGGVKVSLEEWNPLSFSPFADERGIAVALISSQMEIAVGDSQAKSMGRIQEEIGHDHGVDPAAYRKQDRLSFTGKQSAKTFVKTGLQHPRDLLLVGEGICEAELQEFFQLDGLVPVGELLGIDDQDIVIVDKVRCQVE